MEDEYPDKVIDGVKGDRVRQILHSNLVRAPRNHGHDGQTQGNPIVLSNQHSIGELWNCVELYSSRQASS